MGRGRNQPRNLSPAGKARVCYTARGKKGGRCERWTIAPRRPVQSEEQAASQKSVRAISREQRIRTKAASAAREDRAALERIEQLEKAVQELRRGQQSKRDLPALPGAAGQQRQ
jgi:hypothetical protein